MQNNYFHDFLASAAGDKCDITVYRNSSFNTIAGNRCEAGLEADFGVLVQDPGGLGTYLPKYNKVVNNFVSDHKSYGITFYIGGSQQGNNQCIGNTIQNITGTGIAGNSGSGIYCVGNGLGSMLVHGNLVRNCCIDTPSATNGPAGISVNDTLNGGSKIVISSNTVEEMAQAPGILVSTVHGGATVTGNTIRIPSTNDGTGAGGATLQGEGIKIVSSDDVAVTGNVVRQEGAGDCFLSLAAAASMSQINVTGNIFRAATGNAIRFDRSAAFTHTDCVISGNQLRSDAAASLITLGNVDRCSVTGNNGGANTGTPIAIAACTATRISGNSMNTNGATSFSTSGTCTNSFYDRSNYIVGAFSNTGTGCLVEKLLQGTATYDPANLADGAGATTTVTVTGAALGDLVDSVSFSNDLSGMTLTAYVSAADTASVRFQNESGGALDLASGTLTVRVIKK